LPVHGKYTCGFTLRLLLKGHLLPLYDGHLDLGTGLYLKIRNWFIPGN
jgi:hypothetical protein